MAEFPASLLPSLPGRARTSSKCGNLQEDKYGLHKASSVLWDVTDWIVPKSIFKTLHQLQQLGIVNINMTSAEFQVEGWIKWFLLVQMYLKLYWSSLYWPTEIDDSLTKTKRQSYRILHSRDFSKATWMKNGLHWIHSAMETILSLVIWQLSLVYLQDTVIIRSSLAELLDSRHHLLCFCSRVDKSIKWNMSFSVEGLLDNSVYSKQPGSLERSTDGTFPIQNLQQSKYVTELKSSLSLCSYYITAVSYCQPGAANSELENMQVFHFGRPKNPNPGRLKPKNTVRCLLL